MDEELSVLSAERLLVEGDGNFRWALQAARRDLAAFSSEMAMLRVGREEEAMSDILLDISMRLDWELYRRGERGRGYLRRFAVWRALTRPMAAIMGILLRPVVSRRKRSWTSFWEAMIACSCQSLDEKLRM